MTIRVTVVYSHGPRSAVEWEGCLPEGSTVAHALEAAQVFEAGQIGIWGRKSSLDELLRPHDRVEVYRALRVDPKTARRERFQAQGSRATGLFEKKRPGSKAGY